MTKEKCRNLPFWVERSSKHTVENYLNANSEKIIVVRVSCVLKHREG
jgi:hypothetical protein